MNEKEESSKAFWKGLVTGLVVSLLIVVLAFTSVRILKTFRIIGGITKDSTQETVANSGTVEKLSVLEDTIH